MKTLCVVCPVYEEAEVIEAFYAELRAVLAGVADRYRATILFVVDRGRDETLAILKRLARDDPAVRVLALSSRFGHQASLVAGLDHADADALVMLDSDLQHPPALIPTLLAEFEKGYDVVYTLREDSPEVGFLKRISSRLFYRLMNRVAEVPINENAADFRLVSRRVVEVFQRQVRERNPFLRGLFGWVGFPSVGVPFRVARRPAGRSKYSVARMVRFGIDGLVSFSKSPLLISTVLGFAFAAFGLAFSLLTVVQYFVYGQFPSGWATLVILLSIFSGTQLICLGIISQYVGVIFDEVKGRPHYVVEERLNFPEAGRRAEDPRP